MRNTVLIDTNIILDVFLMREPFYYASNNVFQLCLQEKITGVIAAHSFNNIWYIARKRIPEEKLRNLLISLISVFEVESIDKTKIISALENSEFRDFEDCLQYECAKKYECEYIITRDKDDFKNSRVKAILPEDFLEKI